MFYPIFSISFVHDVQAMLR